MVKVKWGPRYLLLKHKTYVQNHSFPVFSNSEAFSQENLHPSCLLLAETTNNINRYPFNFNSWVFSTNPTCKQLLALGFKPSSPSSTPHAIFHTNPMVTMLVHQPSMDSSFRMRNRSLSHRMFGYSEDWLISVQNLEVRNSISLNS
jgi:hypothetical protein